MVHCVVSGIKENCVGHFPDDSPTKIPMTSENITLKNQLTNDITAYNTTQQQMLQQMHTMIHHMHMQISNGGIQGGGGRLVYYGHGHGSGRAKNSLKQYCWNSLLCSHQGDHCRTHA